VNSMTGSSANPVPAGRSIWPARSSVVLPEPDHRRWPMTTRLLKGEVARQRTAQIPAAPAARLVHDVCTAIRAVQGGHHLSLKARVGHQGASTPRRLSSVETPVIRSGPAKGWRRPGGQDEHPLPVRKKARACCGECRQKMVAPRLGSRPGLPEAEELQGWPFGEWDRGGVGGGMKLPPSDVMFGRIS